MLDVLAILIPAMLVHAMFAFVVLPAPRSPRRLPGVLASVASVLASPVVRMRARLPGGRGARLARLARRARARVLRAYGLASGFVPASYAARSTRAREGAFRIRFADGAPLPRAEAFRARRPVTAVPLASPVSVFGVRPEPSEPLAWAWAAIPRAAGTVL